jgi:alkylation response protein AidB-like acyl-CoA dehydrogenase
MEESQAWAGDQASEKGSATMGVEMTSAGAHYLFSDEHEQLRESISRWVADRVVPNIEDWDRAETLPSDIYEEMGALGFLGLQYPEDYGGQGGDFAANLVLCEELSAVGAEALGSSVGVHTAVAVAPLAQFGTDEQKDRWLAEFLSGRTLCAIAITEPDGGSDVAGMRSVAERTADGWLLNGSKTFITNGARAGVIFVIARTSARDAERPAFSLFLVEADRPGVSRGLPLEKIGRHASDTCELFFDHVELPSDALLGEEGRGFHQIMWELDGERIVSAITSVALGYHALGIAKDYVLERRQFGRPIADFQAIRHELANHAAALAAARELTHATAWRFQNGHARLEEISMAKLVAANTLCEVADYALQVHGGYGYMREQSIGRVWIDARAKRITAGTDEIQREIIARHLLGRPEGGR